MVSFITGIALFSVILFIARQFERRNAIETNQSIADVVVDWKLAGLHYTTNRVLAPVTSTLTMMIVNAAGGGWIHLRSEGWWFLFSSAVLILAIDLWTYLIHRAQHRFPVLWAMHSLHHS